MIVSACDTVVRYSRDDGAPSDRTVGTTSLWLSRTSGSHTNNPDWGARVNSFCSNCRIPTKPLASRSMPSCLMSSWVMYEWYMYTRLIRLPDCEPNGSGSENWPAAPGV